MSFLGVWVHDFLVIQRSMWSFHTPLDHITAKNKAKQGKDQLSVLTFSSMSSISALSVV